MLWSSLALGACSHHNHNCISCLESSDNCNFCYYPGDTGGNHCTSKDKSCSSSSSMVEDIIDSKDKCPHAEDRTTLDHDERTSARRRGLNGRHVSDDERQEKECHFVVPNFFDDVARVVTDNAIASNMMRTACHDQTEMGSLPNPFGSRVAWFIWMYVHAEEIVNSCPFITEKNLKELSHLFDSERKEKVTFEFGETDSVQCWIESPFSIYVSRNASRSSANS